MNAKAQKQTVVYPPILNMADEDHKVDTTFQNWEKFNAPIINDRIQNMYISNNVGTNSVYSRKGDRYSLSEGRLYKNGVKVDGSPYFTGTPKKEVIDLPIEAIAYNETSSNAFWIAKDGTFWSKSQGQIGTALVTNPTKARVVTNGTAVIGIEMTSRTLGIYDFNARAGMTYTLEGNWTSALLISNNNSSVLTNSLALTDSMSNFTLTAFFHDSNNLYFSAIASNGTISPSENVSYATFKYTISSRSLVKTSSNNNLGNSYSLTSSTNDGTVFKATTSWSDSQQESKAVKIDGAWYELKSGDSSVSQVTSRGQLSLGEQTDSVLGNVGRAAGKYKLQNGSSFENYDVYSYTIYIYRRSVKVQKVSGSDGTFYLKARPFGNKEFNRPGFDIHRDEENYKYYFTIYLLSGYFVDTDSWCYQTQFRDTGSIAWIVRSLYSMSEIGAAIRAPSISISPYSGWGTAAPYSNVDGYSLIRFADFSNYTNMVYCTPCVIDDEGYWHDIRTAGCPTSNALDGGASKYVIEGRWSKNGVTIDDGGNVSGTVIQINNAFSSYMDYMVLIGKSTAVSRNNIETYTKYYGTKNVSPASLSSGVQQNASGLLRTIWTDGRSYRYGVGGTRTNSFNHYSYNLLGLRNQVGSSDTNLEYRAGGSSTNIGGSWYVLNNNQISAAQTLSGISRNGVLLTPWFSIDTYEYSPSKDAVLYKDTDSKKWFRLTTESGYVTKMKRILGGRYILIPNINTNYMLYDTEKGIFHCYASDWNDRVYYGSTTPVLFQGSIMVGNSNIPINYLRYTASADNASYSATGEPTTSLILPPTPRYYVSFENVDVRNPGSKNVDVYYNLQGSSSTPYYRYSVINGGKYNKDELAELAYPFTTSSSNVLGANLFTEYIDQNGNNDLALEDEYTTYTTNYLDNNIIFNYGALTKVTTDAFSKASFFVIQGQFYGHYNDKIYSLSYSGGILASQDPIVDCRGMRFVGNNPEIAFFYSPLNKAFYSFTGDAKLQLIYDGSKFDSIGKYWYDELGQNIYINTDKGLLVFGARNSYTLPITNVSDVFVSEDGITHITKENGMVQNISYYEKDGYNVIPLDLETSFWGLGSTESISIDRWNITVYDKGHRDVTVTLGVRSLTDITVKSEEKQFHITPNMYDKFSHCVLLSYVPQLIKAQGLRLYIKSPINVCTIVPHIMDNGTGTLTKRQM